MSFQNIRLLGILIAAAMLLLIPLIAMQFTDEVNWDLADFIVMGVLLSGTGLLLELVLRTVKQNQYRLALCAAVLFGFLVVWAELVVGIIGTPFAGS